MSKILVLSTPKKSDYEIGIFNYLKSLNFDVSLIKVDSLVLELGRVEKILYKEQDISEKYDLIIPFISPKYERFYEIILDIFERKGALVYTNKAHISLATNYGELLKEIMHKNINTFKTFISTNNKSLSSIVEDLEMPVLIKIPGEGKNIVINRRDSLVSVLDTIESIKRYIIVKEIYHDMAYEEYLFIDDKVFGLAKTKEGYEKIKVEKEIKDIGKKIYEITKSKIFSYSVLKDENNKPYFDDLLITPNWERFIDHYGNEISLAISNSIVKGKGYKAYGEYVLNLLKTKYLFNKIKKEMF